MKTDFFTGNELDFDKVNNRAKQLFESLGYGQSYGFERPPGSYELAKKQYDFIRHALEDFKNLYAPICKFHADNTRLELWNTVKEQIENRFALGRISRMVGPSAAETTGFFRGLWASFSIFKSEIRTLDAKTKKSEIDKITHLIEFFGDFDEALSIFVEFAIQFALRFQNALYLLANHQDGISNLAEYIATMSLERLLASVTARYELTDTLDDKIQLLMKEILLRRNASAATDQDQNDWRRKILETELETEKVKLKWSIPGLLHKSPIMAESKLYTYVGSGRRFSLFYPAQICTSKAIETTTAFYEASQLS